MWVEERRVKCRLEFDFGNANGIYSREVTEHENIAIGDDEDVQAEVVVYYCIRTYCNNSGKQTMKFLLGVLNELFEWEGTDELGRYKTIADQICDFLDGQKEKK